MHDIVAWQVVVTVGAAPAAASGRRGNNAVAATRWAEFRDGA